MSRIFDRYFRTDHYIERVCVYVFRYLRTDHYIKRVCVYVYRNVNYVHPLRVPNNV